MRRRVPAAGIGDRPQCVYVHRARRRLAGSQREWPARDGVVQHAAVHEQILLDGDVCVEAVQQRVHRSERRRDCIDACRVAAFECVPQGQNEICQICAGDAAVDAAAVVVDERDAAAAFENACIGTDGVA